MYHLRYVNLEHRMNGWSCIACEVNEYISWQVELKIEDSEVIISLFGILFPWRSEDPFKLFF